MEIQIAVAKVSKFGSQESGDSIEIIERPNGGLSAIMCDALGSGPQGRAISGMVVRKVLSLLADGIRDGSAARAASDYLFTERGGHDAAYLNILSADLETGTLVITRNNPAPIFLSRDEMVECLTGLPKPIGTARNIRPLVTEANLVRGTTVVMFTDGVMNAGSAKGGFGDEICTFLEGLLEEQEPTAQFIADSLLSQAIRMDHNRPEDDMSVTVLRVMTRPNDFIRRMVVRLPVMRLEPPEPPAEAD